ncbi:MAG: molybdenum cofactor guanylyltransferase [Phycisphaerales bacterium]|nr:molybdenum cofactor guanylyltransferase [Phycisphaerales bacterium]
MVERELRAGILIGGESRRMGRPKAALAAPDRPLAERIAAVAAGYADEVVLLGSAIADVGPGHRRLEDAAGVGGPLAGILAALRDRPAADWLIIATDMPLVSRAAIEWLLGERHAGRITILPRRTGGEIEPLFALYTAAALPRLERLVARGIRAPHRLAEDRDVHTPQIPPLLEAAWLNVNTPAEWAAIRERLASE